MRLSGKLAFATVYDAGVSESRGPLKVFAFPNGLLHSRLGLSVSRRVGVAPKRNRIKRMLRESVRLLQHELPAGYDWIVVVRQHEPLGLSEYQKLLLAVTTKLDSRWQKKER